MKAIVESIGKVGSRSRVGGHDLVFDQPRSVPGGEDRGIERAVKGCPAYGTLLHPPVVEISVEPAPAATDERRTA